MCILALSTSSIKRSVHEHPLQSQFEALHQFADYPAGLAGCLVARNPRA
jgi:hypothetical protein